MLTFCRAYSRSTKRANSFSARFIVALTAILTLCGTTKAWADATVYRESELRTAVGSSQTVTLGSDIILNSSRLVISGKTVTLNLNGHTLDRWGAADKDGQVIFIADGGKLTITDKSDNSGKITGGRAYQGGGIYVAEGCELTFSGGTITGNRADQIAEGGYGFGGGIENHGTTTITGGHIFGNTAGQYGDDIYQAGTLNIQGNPVINSLYLTSYTLITLTGALTTGASISLDAENVSQAHYTIGYNTYHAGTDPNTYFTSKNATYIVTLNADGEVVYGITYIERAWDAENKQVTETAKVKECNSYTAINGSDDEDWIALYDGWYVVTGNSNYKTLNVVGTDVHLIIPDDVTLTVTGGVKVEEGHQLSIYGQKGDMGKLTATNSYEGAAGIGGGDGAACGNLSIHGGVITAMGGDGGPGIGTGDGNRNVYGMVSVYGGTVTATGGKAGAGIGGGRNSNGTNLYVYGGDVTAAGGLKESGSDTLAGAGIGGGSRGDGGHTTIYGGNVKARGTGDNISCSAGVGGGCLYENSSWGLGGITTVYGGSLRAEGQGYAAGIGGGSYGSTFYGQGGHTYIYGGEVIAIAGEKSTCAIGDGIKYHVNNHGTLADSIMAKGGSTLTGVVKYPSNLRYKAYGTNRCAIIEPCDHKGATYTVAEDTHLKHCAYCTMTFETEPHTFGSDDKCTVCGVEKSTGINAVLNDKVEMTNDKGWYTIDGRRLSEKPSVKGVYINNRKKYINNIAI